MKTITVSDVSDETVRVLEARAVRAEQSLEEYLREALVAMASRPTVSDVLDRARARKAAT